MLPKISAAAFLLFSLVLHYSRLGAQKKAPTLTFRITLNDQISQAPLSQARIRLSDGIHTYQTASNEEGYGSIDSVLFGTYTLIITHPQYNPIILETYDIFPGKGTDLEVSMKERITSAFSDTLETAFIQGVKKERTQASDKAGMYRIDIRNVWDVAGNRNDPVALLKNLPSVTGVDDNRGLISIRGGAPWGLAFRMEGMYITPPIHFANLGITGAHVTMLNDNYLKNFNFYIGSFDAQVGDALGGVADLELRNGSNKTFKGIAALTWNGWEVGIEGPFSKRSPASYLLSYRYSLLGSLAHIGLLKSQDKGGFPIPYYQDLSFKINIPTQKAGTFSFWGIGGPSSIASINNDSIRHPASPDTQGDDFTTLNYNTFLLGMTHTYHFNDKAYGKFYTGSSLYTYSGMRAFRFPAGSSPGSSPFADDPNKRLQFHYRIFMPIAGYDYHRKLNARNDIQAGGSVQYYLLKVSGKVRPSLQPEQYASYYPYLSGNNNFPLIKAYFSYKHYFSETFYINSGIFSQMLWLNKSFSVEPRFSAAYAADRQQQHLFSLTLGLHSQTQPLDLYFFNPGNAEQKQRVRELKLNKSFQTSFSYNYLITPRMNIQLSLYYHYHYDIATDDSLRSFSVLNTGADYFFPVVRKLSNKGRGQTYGIEFMFNHRLYKGFYLTLSGALFDARYTGSDGVWRNTFFNLNRKATLVSGKEWTIGRTKNYKINIGTKINYAGGNWVTPFAPQNRQGDNFFVSAYQENKAFSERLPDYFRWDMRIGYTIIYKKTTHVFYLEYWNLTGRKNVFNRSYDPTTGKPVYSYQWTMSFPIVFYKLYF